MESARRSMTSDASQVRRYFLSAGTANPCVLVSAGRSERRDCWSAPWMAGIAPSRVSGARAFADASKPGGIPETERGRIPSLDTHVGPFS